MRIVTIRCPQCGSPCSKSENLDEYVCSHCGSKFKLLNPSSITITHDERTHNCPVCGKPVPVGSGYKCTECGRIDICDECIDVNEESRYICMDCIKKNGRDCSVCGKFSIYICAACEVTGHSPPTRVCGEHWEFFCKYGSNGEYTRFKCPNCGDICGGCAIERKVLLLKKYICPVCGSDLLCIPRRF